MRKLLLVVFIALTFFYSFSQSTFHNQKLVYNFIRIYFRGLEEEKREFKLDIHLIPFKNRAIDLEEGLNNKFSNERFAYGTLKLDTVLIEKDYDYMKEQLKFWKDSIQLNPKKIRLQHHKILIKDSRAQEEMMFPKFTTYRISVPLFARNKKIVLFYVENFCGLLCGGGQLNILKKLKNGSWKFLGAIPTWVS
jgi:hypothetical protein